MAAFATLDIGDWKEWANLVPGIWFVSRPWMRGFSDTSAMHFGIGIRAIVALPSAQGRYIALRYI